MKITGPRKRLEGQASIARFDTATSRRRFLSVAAGAVVVGAGLSGCGDDEEASPNSASGGGGGGKTIGIELPFNVNDPWKPLMAGAEMEAEARGYEILKSSANLQVEKQLNELNTWIAQGAAALTIFPMDPTALKPVVDRAKAKGIKVVAYASPVPGASGETVFDDPQGAKMIGEAAAEYAKEHFDGKPVVALLTQDTAAVSRTRVMLQEQTLMKLLPDTKVVARVESPSAAKSVDQARTILQAHPDLNMFLGHNDPVLVGAAQAMKSAGREPQETWLGGLDGSKEFMSRLASGDIIGACGALDLIAVGKSTVTVPANLLEGKSPTKIVNRYVLVSSDDTSVAQKFIDQYDA